MGGSICKGSASARSANFRGQRSKFPACYTRRFIGDLSLLASDLSNWGVKEKIIAVFHGDAAYIVLNDDTYNTNRHVKTGNPYGKLIAGLMKQGVQIELCGATAQGNHWGNANLLPGVKVDTNAMVRVTQLEQEGYTLIYE